MNLLLSKLRTILQYNWLFYLLFLIAIIYSIVVVSLPKESIYSLNDTVFNCIITDIYVDGNYLNLKLDGKEKLQASYYFSSYLEKEKFLNEYELGDYIYIEGNLKEASNNTNPNLFNYKKYLYYNDIYYLLEIDSYSKVKDNDNILYALKNMISNRIEKIDKSSHYLKALILGDDRYINKDIVNIYQDIGISHLFAISGTHITVFAGLLLFFFKRIRMEEKIRYFIVTIFLLFYMFITGFSPSIIRAVVIFVLLSINKIFSLKMKTLNVFILGISLILFLNPFIIFQIGFQFSAIISLVLISCSNLINSQKGYFRKVFITSLISFLVSLPICLYNFYQINILSVIYNMFFIPFMNCILFPVTLITFLFPVFDHILSFIINVMEYITRLCGSIPSVLVFKKPNIFVVLLYFVLIFVMLKRWSRSKFMVYIFIVFLGIHYNYNYIFSSDYIIFIDVGQGDSILIHSHNESLLIDTGGKITYKKEEWEERTNNNRLSDNTVIPLLKSLGIRRLDYLILTHGDYDHMGEAINLVNTIKVEEVILNNDAYNELELEFIKVLEKKKIPYYQNMKELNINNNQLFFLNDGVYDNENDNSNVIYMDFKEIKLLLMGDAGVEVEEDILEKYELDNIDILKVGHHGSKTSSSKEFIDIINPKYSVISVGKNNRFGHPNNEVLNNLNNSKIYRTDQHGSITFMVKKNKLKIETHAP